MNDVFISTGNFASEVEAEIGVMLSQIKENMGLLEARGGKKGSSSRGFGGSMTLFTS